jgi:hypothetical protein
MPHSEPTHVRGIEGLIYSSRGQKGRTPPFVFSEPGSPFSLAFLMAIERFKLLLKLRELLSDYEN